MPRPSHQQPIRRELGGRPWQRQAQAGKRNGALRRHFVEGMEATLQTNRFSAPEGRCAHPEHAWAPRLHPFLVHVTLKLPQQKSFDACHAPSVVHGDSSHSRATCPPASSRSGVTCTLVAPISFLRAPPRTRTFFICTGKKRHVYARQHWFFTSERG